ncbi:hypothetical protein GGR52DRAFT_575396 [Hypoxylon sp. FL1284]|nr:hypothetical protein GGR52DRAFT_575396 [Hypoxylon sp. FL1284]
MDHPALPRPLHEAIAKAHGSSVVLDATRKNLDAGKTLPTPSLKEMIEIKTRENGENLQEEAQYLSERLQFAVNSFRKGMKDIDKARRGE